MTAIIAFLCRPRHVSLSRLSRAAFACATRLYLWIERHSQFLFRLGVSICFALALVSFGLIVLASLSVRPLWDDFGLLRVSRADPPLEIVFSTYDTLTGRFAFIWTVSSLMRLAGEHLELAAFAGLMLWIALWLWAFARRGAVWPALAILVARGSPVRKSFNDFIPKVCEPRGSISGAKTTHLRTQTKTKSEFKPNISPSGRRREEHPTDVLAKRSWSGC